MREILLEMLWNFVWRTTLDVILLAFQIKLEAAPHPEVFWHCLNIVGTQKKYAPKNSSNIFNVRILRKNRMKLFTNT